MSTQIEFTYTFNTPREIVFKAFTESQQLRNWWGPKGWEFQVAKEDFRTNGVFLYSQKPADGDIMWVKFVYSEIVASEKISYSSFFSDEEGNVIRAPFDANWPLETLNTMTFTEDNGKTILTTIIVPGSPTEEENNTFNASSEMVQSGFIGTYDQLTEYLNNRTKE